MRRIALNMVSALALIFTFSVVVVNTSQACSGGYPPGPFPLDYILGSDFLESYQDSIAIGEVSAAGNSEINVILTVDHYLREPQTEGSLLLMQDSLPVIHNTLVEGRRYPANCSYLSPKVNVGRQFIGSLFPSNNGTYHGIVLTADENGLFHFRLQDQPDIMQTFTTAELLAYVETRLETTAIEPEHYTTPRPVSVRLFTQTGEAYFLPVDESSPIEMEFPSKLSCGFYNNDRCTSILVAPNGLDRVSFYPIGTGVNEWYTEEDLYIYHVEGEAGVFSLDSDFVTIWTGNQLKVLTPDSHEEDLMLVAHLTASSDDSLLAGAGAWSPNGRTFAFSTESGVWVWDAFTPDAQPTLLVSATDQPIRVRHYSPLGNHLALESGTHRYNLDVISGRVYPDGLFSPDDRLLAAYDTAATGLTPLTLASMRGYSPQITQFEWITSSKYLYAACGEPLYFEDSEGFEEPWCKVFTNRINYNGEWVDGTAFDYEPVTDSLGVVVDGHTISINGEVIDLSGALTDDIVRLELVPLIDLNHELMSR